MSIKEARRIFGGFFLYKYFIFIPNDKCNFLYVETLILI